MLRTHCIYNTEGNNGTIYGGPSTLDEMCINYIFYYAPVGELVNDDVRISSRSFYTCIDWDSYVTRELDQNPFE